MIPYFLMVALTVALAAALAFLSFRPAQSWSGKLSSRWLWGMTIAAALIHIGLGLYRWRALQMGLWDFGIYDSMVHYAATGQGLMRDYRGAAYDHFSPVVLLLAPLYWLWDSPVWLVLFQALALAAGAPVLYALTRHYFRSEGAPLLLAAMYLLNPYYSRLMLYDFHIECLFPVVFLSSALLWSRGRRNWAAALLLATPLIKEDFVIPLAGMGLFFLFTPRHRKLGALLLAAALAWTGFVLKIYFPHLVHMNYWHFDRYAPAEGGVAAWLLTFEQMFCKLFSLRSLAVLTTVLLPFAFLPLAAWKMFLLVIGPSLGVHLVGNFFHQNWLYSHYSSALIGVVPVAALLGLRYLRAYYGRKRRQPLSPRLLYGALVLTLVSHVTFVELPRVRFYSPAEGWIPKFHLGLMGLPLRPAEYRNLAETLEHAARFREVVALIPPGSRVTAQNEVGCELLRDYQVYSLRQEEPSEYYLFDRGNYCGFEGVDELNRAILKLLQEPYRVRLWLNTPDGILLFGPPSGPAAGRAAAGADELTP